MLEEAFETGDAAGAIVERRGLRQVVDASALEAWVDEAIAENPESRASSSAVARRGRSTPSSAR